VLPRRCCQWIADRRGDQTLQPDQVREMAREEIEKALTPAINAAVLANCNVVRIWIFAPLPNIKAP